MHARSAVFDVYGDLLADRDHQSTVAGLVRLLSPVGITAPAVRTAVSRMVAQEWLVPVRLPAGRGYRATARTVQRCEDAVARAHRTTDVEWDGHWHLALTTVPQGRTERARIARELAFLGYAALQENTWVSPYAHPDLDDTLVRNGVTVVRVRTDAMEPADAPLRAWDLDALAASYTAWHAAAADRVQHHLQAHKDPDEAAFAARFHLVHEWRNFLFTDPGLPLQMLPEDWPGLAAAAYFRNAVAALDERATRFTTRVLSEE